MAMPPAPPIKNRQAVPFTMLQTWIDQLLANNPHLRNQENEAAKALSGPVAFAQTQALPSLRSTAASKPLAATRGCETGSGAGKAPSLAGDDAFASSDQGFSSFRRFLRSRTRLAQSRGHCRHGVQRATGRPSRPVRSSHLQQENASGQVTTRPAKLRGRRRLIPLAGGRPEGRHSSDRYQSSSRLRGAAAISGSSLPIP